MSSRSTTAAKAPVTLPPAAPAKKKAVKPAWLPKTAEDKREVARVAKLTDLQVLDATDRGRFGPALVGYPLALRAQAILLETGGGVLGPAITDPDYAAKQLRKRELEREAAPTKPKPATDPAAGDPKTGPIDPTDLSDERNPWHYITLSGAKMLAMNNGVSYAPKTKREDLIASLQKAKIEPPPVPTDLDDDDDEPEG